MLELLQMVISLWMSSILTFLQHPFDRHLLACRHTSAARARTRATNPLGSVHTAKCSLPYPSTELVRVLKLAPMADHKPIVVVDELLVLHGWDAGQCAVGSSSLGGQTS